MAIIAGLRRRMLSCTKICNNIALLRDNFSLVFLCLMDDIEAVSEFAS